MSKAITAPSRVNLVVVWAMLTAFVSYVGMVPGFEAILTSTGRPDLTAILNEFVNMCFDMHALLWRMQILERFDPPASADPMCEGIVPLAWRLATDLFFYLPFFVRFAIFGVSSMILIALVTGPVKNHILLIRFAVLLVVVSRVVIIIDFYRTGILP